MNSHPLFLGRYYVYIKGLKDVFIITKLYKLILLDLGLMFRIKLKLHNRDNSHSQISIHWPRTFSYKYMPQNDRINIFNMAFTLHVGQRFSDLESLDLAIKKYEKESFTILTKSDSHRYDAPSIAKQYKDKPFKKELKYVDIKYRYTPIPTLFSCSM